MDQILMSKLRKRTASYLVDVEGMVEEADHLHERVIRAAVVKNATVTKGSPRVDNRVFEEIERLINETMESERDAARLNAKLSVLEKLKKALS